ncbi:MAG: DUF72 domain-containing protein [Spirochaetales bacterium]|jgi:uncharacterized protein YecE (DUF72 family)|nr:DUF72 domain-containing protein [Spirochaetales bacterium]
MSATIYIGTSGYSYADWMGSFYPADLPKKDLLNFYASKFQIVELNFSYYRQPTAGMLNRMLDITPEQFQFSIKAHGSLTHNVEQDWRKDAAEYKRGVAPLLSSDRLTAVLLQFPYSFHYEKDNRRYLANLCDELKSLPLVIEFRSAEWQTERVYGEMRERGIGISATDCPALKNLPAPSETTTSKIGYIRFHGRNGKNWWNGTNASRYDYLYNDEELDEWLNRINQMSKNTKILVIVFNNHWRGKAVQNAGQLKEKITQQTGLHIV